MRSIEIDVRLVNGHAEGKPIVLRVKRSTGTDDARTAKAMAAMVRQLWRQPQNRHFVEELADGRRSLLDVFAAFDAGQLAKLAPAFEDREVEPLRDTWLATFQASESHKHRIRQAFGKLLEGERSTVRLSDLPRFLASYRVRCFEKGTPRAFNYAKAALLAFLRDNGVGKRHAIRQDVEDVPGMTELKAGVEGFTIADARAVRDRLAAISLHPHGAKKEDQSRGEEAARDWWTLCLTGMNPREYFEGQWTPLADRVRITGTKRPGRRWGALGREVPRLAPLVRSTLSQDWFARLLKRAGATPYQGRKTFTRLLEDAGVPRTRRQLYLGHGVRDITDRYERHEISAFLAEDAERLAKFLGQAVGLQLVQEG